MQDVRREGERILVGRARLVELVAAIFAQLGCDADEAQRIGTRLTGANLCGHDSHGVVRAPRYVKMVAEGSLIPGRRIEVVHEPVGTSLLASVDRDAVLSRSPLQLFRDAAGYGYYNAHQMMWDRRPMVIGGVLGGGGVGNFGSMGAGSRRTAGVGTITAFEGA